MFIFFILYFLFSVKFRDKWDHDHVRMPCSQQNKFPAQAEETSRLVSRWELICRALNKPMATSYDLEVTLVVTMIMMIVDDDGGDDDCWW